MLVYNVSLDTEGSRHKVFTPRLTGRLKRLPDKQFIP